MKITLCIDKQNRGSPSEELKEYVIDIGCPLRSIDDVFDELRISSDDDTGLLVGQITRRCYVDKYGVLKKLSQEEIQELEVPDIELFEGTNYVYIKEYTNLNMKLEYLTNAEMNKYFATKTEMHSSIRQASNEIDLSTTEKIETATGTDELIAKINLKPGKIQLEGTITANGNFKVLKDGSIEATNGSFKGDIYLTGSESKVVGGQGMMTNLQFPCNFGESDLGWYSQDGYTFTKHGLQILYNIPSDFTITKAFVTLTHIITNNTVQTSSGTSTYTGYARNVKLYQANNFNGIVYTRYYLNGDPDYSSLSKSEIANLDGISPNSTSIIKTADIKNSLITGSTQMLLIDTSDAFVSGEADALQKTARASAILTVYGYTKFA